VKRDAYAPTIYGPTLNISATVGHPRERFILSLRLCHFELRFFLECQKLSVWLRQQLPRPSRARRRRLGRATRRASNNMIWGSITRKPKALVNGQSDPRATPAELMLEQPRRDKAAAALQVKSHRFMRGLPPSHSPTITLKYHSTFFSRASFVLRIACLPTSSFCHCASSNTICE
jgi:hypothetical protein